MLFFFGRNQFLKNYLEVFFVDAPDAKKTRDQLESMLNELKNDEHGCPVAINLHGELLQVFFC